MGNEASSHDDRLLDLARRLLVGEAIDWEKEGVEKAVVRANLKRLEPLLLRRESSTQTKDAQPAPQ